MDKKGFTLIEILVAIVVIGIGFGIILLTTSNVEQAVINNNRDINSYFLAQNRLNRYILEKAYDINLSEADHENWHLEFDKDEKDTFFDKLGLYSVSHTEESPIGEDSEISLKRYAFSNEQ